MKNQFAIAGGIAYIFLPRKDSAPLACQVSLRDFWRVSSVTGRWGASWAEESGTFYARTTKCVDGRKTYIQMHRFILRLKSRNRIPDHLDHDGINNLRTNLVIGTTAQNILNQRSPRADSGYTGVHLDKRIKSGKGWQAHIKINRRNMYLGSFSTAQEASAAVEAARDRARKSMRRFAV